MLPIAKPEDVFSATQAIAIAAMYPFKHPSRRRRDFYAISAEEQAIFASATPQERSDLAAEVSRCQEAYHGEVCTLFSLKHVSV